MPNIDPDLHYDTSISQPATMGSTAFKFLTVFCAVAALGALIDIFVSVPMDSRVGNAILAYSVPAMILLSAIFFMRTADKLRTYAGIIAFIISSLAHAIDLWITGFDITSGALLVATGFFRVALFGIYILTLVSAFFFLLSADKMFGELRERMARDGR